jgi:hypothetical protein
MKAKTIILLFAVLLAAGSISFAGDQKPFKGWVQAVGDPDFNVNPLDYQYLKDVILQRGWPAWAQIQLYQGVNNVGGASIHENAQMFYWDFVSPTIEFYEDSAITVANGDQIFVQIEAVYYVATGEFTATETVVGGTGRFEGAGGSLVVRSGVDKDGLPIVIYDGGYITTVGAAKKN